MAACQRMVAELIDHIEVYHAEKQDAITNQRVDIHYNCIGAFDVPDRRKIPEADIIMETRKGVALSYAPERLAVWTFRKIKKQSVHYRILRSYKDTLHGRSVIIGFQKTQIYQRFAGRQQEVFILKFQNDENNATQQDNGWRFHNRW